MNLFKSFFKWVSITDYSIVAVCVLFLAYYQYSEPNLKFVKSDYVPVDFKSFKLPNGQGYAIIQSYRFLFKNKSFKKGSVFRIESFLDNINVTNTEIYSCWINNVKIGPFSEEQIQIDIAITSKDSSILLPSNENFFKVYFYDSFNNLIEFDKSNNRAEQKIRFNSFLYDSIQKQKKKSLYNPLQEAE